MKLFLDVSPNAIQLWKAEEYCLLRIEFDYFGIENYTNISLAMIEIISLTPTHIQNLFVS